MQGKSISGYTLQRHLGTGGMAEVWYAENKIGKKAAVKLLLPKLCQDENVVSRFLTEAKVMVALDHPNIRQVYDYGDIDGRPAIVMEYLEGDDLKARLKRGQRFTDEELKRWWNQLADALNYTHQQGIVHRDIKPGNIFVDKKGDIKLLDFGIAKVRESISSTQTGQKLGTLMYMSPEQVKDSKHIDYRTDVYSLAVTFVHLLTGKRPYDSDTSSDFEISENIVYKPLDLSDLPANWQGFLAPYLEKEPQKRPALKHFVATAHAAPQKPVSDGDDETELGGPSTPQAGPSKGSGTGSRASASSKGTPSNTGRHSGPDPLSPKPAGKPKPKPKTGLWIGLGVAAAAVVALVVLLAKPKEPSYIPIEVVEEANTDDNIGDLTVTANGVSFVMKRVAGGTFQMGSDDSEAWDDEKPVHSVTVSTFYMGETEVTQALWKAVMGSNPSYFKGDNLPVESVSWNDCQEFIRKLNQLTGRSFRLPTEAEWEYAARGGSRSNGTKYAGSVSIDSVAWYGDNSGSKTHPVKGKSPNELGLYDMSGNVWEWCGDWYGDYGSGSQTNPKGPSAGSDRVLRGGGWGDYAGRCRVSRRNDYTPDSRGLDNGFRLVLPQ